MSPHPRTMSRYSGCLWGCVRDYNYSSYPACVDERSTERRDGSNCSTPTRTTPRYFSQIGFSNREHAAPRFPTYVCSLSFSLVASRGARVCYRDSWQHHGPAFAAWPAIVFLVSLQSTARSILPRSNTATSASFAASYFTGAQHGVARYLGNFAERGCSLC